MDIANHLRLRARIIRYGIAARREVTQHNQRGDPLGDPASSHYPTTMRFGSSSVEGKNGALQHTLPHRLHPAIILNDIKRGSTSFSYGEDLWWADDIPVQDAFVGRHTRTAIEGYASINARGSSSTPSGPEGTLVLFPPRIPRQLATARGVAGARRANVLLNYANDHMSVPDVPVAPGNFSGRGAP